MIMTNGKYCNLGHFDFFTLKIVFINYEMAKNKINTNFSL